jgi:amino acid adenylation domain-containing protein
MNAAEVLAYFREAGAELWKDGDRIRYRAARGIITPAIRRELAQHKSELLDFLASAKPLPISVLPSLQPVTRNKELPLSFAQERIWFLSQLDPESPFYNVHLAIRITGPLNLVALEQSFSEIVRRHEILRTTCSEIDGKPALTVVPALTLTLPLVDLRQLPKGRREAEVVHLATAEAREPINLSKGPLLRVKLLLLNRQENVLLLTTHHFVSDGVSMRVLLMRELTLLYKAFSNDEPSSLSELPIQYADFSYWQRQYLKDNTLEDQIAYWKKKLMGAPALKIATDHGRPPILTFEGRTHSFKLPMHLSEAIKGLSRQQGTTLFMTLLAAFQTLLHRYSCQDDIVIGTVVSNRSPLETEELIGPFANSLALRTDFSGNPTFVELLTRVHDVVTGAFAHQDLPFEKLVEELRPERDLSCNPLFQIVFVLHSSSHDYNLNFPGARLRSLGVERGTTRFDLVLEMVEGQEELLGTLEYSTALFNDSTIERVQRHYQTLLEGIVANPNQRISNLALLTEPERQQLLVEWNDTKRDYPQDQCIHELFETQAQKTPDSIAVASDSARLTYRELNRRANQLAHHLQAACGVRPEVLVGVYLERSLEMISGILGILKAGGAYLPLDPAYPEEYVKVLLQETQASLVLTQSRFLNRLPKNVAQVVCVDERGRGSVDEENHNFPAKARANNLAYVIYTSGSTGRPRGVAIEHHSVVNLIYWAKEILGLPTHHKVLASSSICFDLSVFELFFPLSWGGQVILVDNLLSLSALPATREVTFINTVPSAIAEITRIDGIPASARTVILAGELLQKTLVRQLYQRDGIQRVFNFYGPSEATVYATFALLRKNDQNLPSIGRPIANTQVYVLDRYLNSVPVGVVGEIYIGGAGLARGYVNRPELTAEKFIASPFSREPGARLHRTGDLARYLPGGNLEFIGRMDERVKIRGYRIEMGAVEAAMAGHPAIREAAVVVGEDQWGEKRLIAYGVCVSQQVPTTSELRNFLKGKLPQYMVPSVFIVLDAFPLTGSGKIDRKSLPPPDRVRSELKVAYREPRDAAERSIVAVWKKVLGVEKVGIDDNFFDLGGHSLLMLRVHSELQNIFLRHLRLVEMYECPTVRSLAERLTQETHVDVSLAEIVDRAHKQRVAMNRNSGRVKARETP